jgi:N-acetyl-gamma-glutamyl-phosphate reductase
MVPVPVAIIGASGYTGAELLRLLLRHPGVQVAAIAARRAAGQSLADVFPHLGSAMPPAGQTIEAFDADALAARAKVAFSCLPHGEAQTVVTELHERGLTVLDLSQDFRLRATQTLPAVYGLPERYREALRGARVIAVPGCYPTASILAIAPLLDRGLVSRDGLVIDAKSGASGAGRTPGQSTHLPEAGESLRPYKVGGQHRHTAEIEQELGGVVLFTPHLVPMSRGILSCVYGMPVGDVRDPDSFRQALAEAYAGEPFVDVLPEGAVPDTAHVRGSNRAHVTAVYDPRSKRVLAIGAIDNLVKGASGQAVQCMNLALGLPETQGLEQLALFP